MQTESPEVSARDRRAFVLRKLHSLSGVVPLGVYLAFHLWTNAKAMQGRQIFDDAMTDRARWPYLAVIEIVGIGVPLLFHAIYGIVIALEARPNVRRYPHSANWTYSMQRITGAAVLAFIVWHVWTLRVPVALGTLDRVDYFPTLCDELSSTVGPGVPLVALAYLLGTAAAVYHFSVGLYGFCFSWGITLSRRASRIAGGVFGVAGLLLFLLGANTIIYYATGWKLELDAMGRHEGPPAITCRDFEAAASTIEESHGRGEE